MEFLAELASQAFSWNVMFLAFVGTLVGIVAAAIPGFTILMAIVLVFPFTFAMSPLEGLSTLIGVYVGGFSGGQISGILLGIPGTPSSICTVFDGYPMAKSGRAGEALGLGIFSSFFGGIIGGIIMVLFIKPVSEFGLKFGPWELFGLIFFSLTLIASLGGKSFFKGMASGFLGLVMSMVGTDNTGGLVRFTFDMPELLSGFSLLPVLVGLFALPSLLAGMQTPTKLTAKTEFHENEVRIPYRKVFKDLRGNWWNLIRSSLFGSFVGALPGEGGSVANFLAYDQAKRYSKTPEQFGKGCPDGVVASESGNNACAGGGLIPTLALGIPGTASDAVLLGVLMVHSIPPGPALFKDSAMLVYGLFVVYFVAHFFMIAIQLGAGSRVFLRLTQCPQWGMIPVVLLMCAIGCFALNNQTFDIWLFVALGVVGFIMDRAGYPLAPIVIGLLLGGMCEENLRQAFSIDSDWTLFFTRPISAFFMALTVLSIAYCGWQYQKSKKQNAIEAQQDSKEMITISIKFSAALVLVAIGFYLGSLELPGASRWDPIGSRLIPQIMIVGLGFFALGSLILSWMQYRQKSSDERVIPFFIRYRRESFVFVLLFLWVFAIPYLGFYTSALFFLMATIWFLKGGRVSWAMMVLPVVMLSLIYGIFGMFLKLQLPMGWFM
ncbi:MAG: tripartite tricarboxylate transporter permease [Burkholderiaceae bacterium]|nr:tripartite tricarboxylate transporter permease [Burkholderiaceae bacterium]